VQKFLLTIDKISNFFGKTFAWTIVALTVAIAYEVFSRYAFRAPTTWAFDVSYILYGTLFMMAGAYAMARNGHVRGDFLYRNFAPRRQAALDLALWLLFFYPAMAAMAWMGWRFFLQSYAQNEHSSFSPEGPVIWPFKFLIPFVGALMSLQGVAEVVRCVICLRDGEWPPRLHDVEEMEKLILERAEAERQGQA
jgi:TRAP-type mannitol/chloroaromatic compound transport system permease small subunit